MLIREHKWFIIALIVIGLLIAVSFVSQSSASKYPPEVAALVKLKHAVTYPDGQIMGRARRIRVNRNVRNAYKKNKSGCFGVTGAISRAHSYSSRNEHGLAMVQAQRAINRAYACRDAHWRKANVR